MIGEVNGAFPVFTTMMIPERLGTAAMTIGPARSALEIATRYTSKRKAFGETINRFQGVSFQVAEGAMLLDACRALVYATSRAVDARHGHEPGAAHGLRDARSSSPRSCQKVVHNSMQVVGGIGYTNVFPLERIYRDIRLASIWTGTNEVMASIVAHEWYREAAAAPTAARLRRRRPRGRGRRRNHLRLRGKACEPGFDTGSASGALFKRP